MTTSPTPINRNALKPWAGIDIKIATARIGSLGVKESGVFVDRCPISGVG
jgi:hypothetical protein